MVQRSSAALALAIGCAGGAGLPAAGGASAAQGSDLSDVPYVTGSPLPGQVSSPAVDPQAPYTPLVRSLIAQLEPTNPPTAAQLSNAARLFEGGISASTGSTACHAVGGVGAPVGTTPSISPLCWADSVGVNIILPPNNGHTTATPEPLAIGSSFDVPLANAWGQVEGAEGRQLMVTGLFGPEADVSIYPNWERGLDTLGEDPFVNATLVAAQVHGMQGRGLMAQVKHFAAFTGANRYTLTEVADQPLHETLLKPFETAFTSAQAASTMCAYEEYRDTSPGLPGPQNALAAGASPYATSTLKTWPLDQARWACEQPLAVNYVLRRLWRSAAFVGSDFPATHSTSAMTQGETQEFFTPSFFGNSDPTTVMPPAVTVGTGSDPTGDTCAANGMPASCTDPGAQHVGGIPGAGCNPNEGCGLVNAVATGNLPLAVLNQALAEVLYQEQRMGLLGCDDQPRAAICTNPGGVNGDRTGNSPLPSGPASGATAAANLGSENGDAAVAERLSEEGAVLLKNNSGALPLNSADLHGGVAVSGPGAEYLIAEPSDEASTGFPDRISISPLAQLKALGSEPNSISYTPAQGPTGEPVPPGQLSTTSGQVDGALQRTAGPGSPAHDPTLDFTKVSSAGQLPSGDYVWTGYVYVPQADRYTFRFQYTPGAALAGAAPVTFTLDNQRQSLSAAASFYCGQYFPSSPVCVPVSPTNPGYTEGGLTNQQTAPTDLASGFHQVTIAFRNDAGGNGSLRFAYSRGQGDVADAAAAAKSKAAAVVFVNDNGVTVVNQDAYTAPSTGVATLPNSDVQLIDAVAAANPNTIVVMNTADPVVLKPWIDNPNVKAVLEMWNAGSEGGTATARLLLGQADPSGHSVLTWPAGATDTIWGHPESTPLYPGDSLGAHPERLNGLTDASAADCGSYVPPPSPCTKTVLTQGIFSGYRYYDKEDLAPEFPFGFGLSYTTFRFSRLTTAARDGGTDVSFDLTNTGSVAGSEVAQVYVGPASSVPPGVQQAIRSLAGFDRVALDPGQTKRVTIHIGPGRDVDGTGDRHALDYWSVPDQAWVTPSGARTIRVGAADSTAALPLSTSVAVRGSRPVLGATLVSLPASSCAASRRLTFRINPPRRHGLVSGRVVKVIVYVNGHRLLTRKARRGHVITRVTFRRPTLGNLSVKIVSFNDKGGRVITVRRFRGCTHTKTKGNTKRHKVKHGSHGRKNVRRGH